MSFGYLKKLAVKKSAVRYTLDAITVQGRTAALLVLPATEENSEYLRKTLINSSKTMSRISRGGIYSKEMMDRVRDMDRELFPRHVITDWENIFDENGQEVPFSQDKCAEFLEQLPDDMFADLQAFCKSPNNFREDVDFDDLAKNSQSVPSSE